MVRTAVWSFSCFCSKPELCANKHCTVNAIPSTDMAHNCAVDLVGEGEKAGGGGSRCLWMMPMGMAQPTSFAKVQATPAGLSMDGSSIENDLIAWTWRVSRPSYTSFSAYFVILLMPVEGNS